LYSPELIVAEEEFLTLLKSDPQNSMLESARTRLVLFGLSDNQVNELIRTRNVPRTVTVYSPVSGYVATHSPGDKEQQNADMPKARVGMYVNKGQEIFTVVSHRDLWAEFSIYPRDLAAIKLGDSAVVTVDESYGTMLATVDRIQPAFDDPSSLVKVRMRLINPHHQYHAGQYLTARFTQHADSTLWIPKSAQIDMGINHIVFLKRNNAFKPIKIKTGASAADWIQVVGGLKPYDSIAYNASFLVDSEDFIKPN
jgi:Cu(I)/Ag(I) efflux system membrane fusion protein